MKVADILRAEHDIMDRAFCEWIGEDKDSAMSDIQYLWGVHDFAEKLICLMEAEGNDDC
ncbi:MAG: hypothetical protein J6R54_02180 [Bacteroidaceae bacterium]|nr:hypothetical protein [Bacteroidaceae bacterium]